MKTCVPVEIICHASKLRHAARATRVDSGLIPGCDIIRRRDVHGLMVFVSFYLFAIVGGAVARLI